MPGIYIHVPFCRRKCHYCNFYSMTLLQYRKDYREGLLKEIRLRKGYLSQQPVQTIYFGGGTPSLLVLDDLEKIFDALNGSFQVAGDAEITLEANPDDLTEGYLDGLRHLPVNRLSIGIQSFCTEDLHFLNRIHSSQQAVASLHLARRKGFDNLSIDLIYGIPAQTTERWYGNLQKAFSFHIPHVSAYALTVESNTPLENLIRREKIQAPDEECMVEHFHILCDQMEKHGYTHYEISNFCRDGLYARHNVSYWANESYLGLGPAAHSYNGHSRQWNKADLKSWLDSLSRDQPCFDLEMLSPGQRYNEYVMTSLRTMWGCSTDVVLRQFGQDYHRHLLRTAAGWITSGHLTMQNDTLKLTRSGMLFADRIASDFFRIDD
ncbi:MAG: radical SAM family heme chaperone HemW [Bacteroidales bacterium]|nr:radical SAM family heme chaperone HemW [Bacteroidales bacterium]